MLYLLDAFELDTEQLELRRNGLIVPVERQVFAVLRVLLENRDRVVTKEELVEKVWSGRFVSDSPFQAGLSRLVTPLETTGKISVSFAPCTVKASASSQTSGSLLLNA